MQQDPVYDMNRSRGGMFVSAIEQMNNLIGRYPQLIICRDEIWDAYQIIRRCYQEGGYLLVCGNGGSAADANHIVGELMKEFSRKRPLPESVQKNAIDMYGEDGRYLAANLQGALPVISLAGNVALLTAYANDAEPDLVYAQQVNGYGREGCVLLGISTSGNSRNVLYAAMMAQIKKMMVIGLSGQNGGALKEIADSCICVPATLTPDIQELHLPVYHCLCRMIEDTFF